MRSKETLNDKKTLVIEVDLKRVSSKLAFFKMMEDLFYLPSYFKFSYDSLDECLRDLSWIEDQHILIKIKNLDRIKNKSLRDDVSHCFETYKKYWSHSSIKNVEFEVF